MWVRDWKGGSNPALNENSKLQAKKRGENSSVPSLQTFHFSKIHFFIFDGKTQAGSSTFFPPKKRAGISAHPLNGRWN
jgi:hypothetical protein